jgi:acetyl esterase/lipase
MSSRSHRQQAQRFVVTALVGFAFLTGSAVLARSELFASSAPSQTALAPRALVARVAGSTTTRSDAPAPPPCWEPADGTQAPASACTVPPPGPGDMLPVGYEAGVGASIPNLQYGPDAEQLLDLYLPQAIPAPVLVYFHAGGWVAGERGFVAQSILREVGRGYAVASVEYRLAPRVVFPVPLQDAKTAVRWVKAHAQEFGLRADMVFATGASAGGHLAAMVATTPGRFEPTDLSPELAAQDSRVAGAVSLVGPLDLNALGQEVGTWGPPLVSTFLGCPAPGANQPATCSAAAMAAASPINYVTPDDPPIYLSYGMQDELVTASANGLAMAVDYAQLGRRIEARYDLAQHQGHNVDIDGTNVTMLDQFLDSTRDGVLQ